MIKPKTGAWRFSMPPAIAVLAIALLIPATSTLAAPDCSKHPDNPNCGGGGGGEGAIVYTAELTGAFVFSEDVTPNSRENQLRSTEALDMVRPEDEELEATWDDVFNECGELLTDTVAGITVGDDNWSIDKTGVEVNGVVVIFHDIRLQEAEVTVQLMGNDFNFIAQPFLPEPGQNPGDTETSEFILRKFAIHGSTEKGVHPRSGCQPHGGGGFDIHTLGDPSTLMITATRQ